MNNLTLKVRENAPNLESIFDLAQYVIDGLDISNSTCYEYKRRSEKFVNFWGKNSDDYNVLISYKKYLANRNDYTVSTKNKYLAVARILVKEFVNRGYLPQSFPKEVKSFKQSKKHKRYGISESELERISQWTNKLSNTPENLRLRAILSLLTLQGLRQIEICRLDVSDFDSSQATLLVQSKGSNDKELVFLHSNTVSALETYLKTLNIKSGPMFISFSNNNKNQRLSTKGLRKIVKGCMNELGIDKTTHGFRHYFVTRLIKAYEGNIVEVAEFTRHRSLDMLQIYNDAIASVENRPKFHAVFSEISL